MIDDIVFSVLHVHESQNVHERWLLEEKINYIPQMAFYLYWVSLYYLSFYINSPLSVHALHR